MQMSITKLKFVINTRSVAPCSICWASICSVGLSNSINRSIYIPIYACG